MEEEFIRGLKFSLINSRDFYDDAELLENNKRIVRSYVFYQLCIEECGRFFMIYNALCEYYKEKLPPKELNGGKLKRLGFERHTDKTKINFENLIIINTIFLQMSDLKNKAEKQEYISKNISELIVLKEELNDLKNESLYVSFANNKFHLPGDNISLFQFGRIKRLANISINTIERLKEFYELHGGFKELKNQYIEPH